MTDTTLNNQEGARDASTEGAQTAGAVGFLEVIHPAILRSNCVACHSGTGIAGSLSFAHPDPASAYNIAITQKNAILNNLTKGTAHNGCTTCNVDSTKIALYQAWMSNPIFSSQGSTGSSGGGGGTPQSDQIAFDDVVLPILQNKCASCHNGSGVGGSIHFANINPSVSYGGAVGYYQKIGTYLRAGASHYGCTTCDATHEETSTFLNWASFYEFRYSDTIEVGTDHFTITGAPIELSEASQYRLDFGCIDPLLTGATLSVTADLTPGGAQFPNGDVQIKSIIFNGAALGARFMEVKNPAISLAPNFSIRGGSYYFPQSFNLALMASQQSIYLTNLGAYSFEQNVFALPVSHIWNGAINGRLYFSADLLTVKLYEPPKPPRDGTVLTPVKSYVGCYFVKI